MAMTLAVDLKNQEIMDLNIWLRITHHDAGADLILNDRFYFSINHWYSSRWFSDLSPYAISFQVVFENVESELQKKLLYHLDLLNV